jgi:hypothetical protein
VTTYKSFTPRRVRRPFRLQFLPREQVLGLRAQLKAAKAARKALAFKRNAELTAAHQVECEKLGERLSALTAAMHPFFATGGIVEHQPALAQPHALAGH